MVNGYAGIKCCNEVVRVKSADDELKVGYVGKAFIWLWLVVALSISMLVLPVVDRHSPGFDFVIYSNEAIHVLKGIDPFDVLVGNVKSEGYYPLGSEESAACLAGTIDANAPWSYTYILPFAADIPKDVIWQIWELCQFLFLGLIVAFAFWIGKTSHGFYGGIFVASVALSVGLTFTRNFLFGNLIMAVAAGMAGMIFCLDRKWDVAAGICWAVAVIKPQDSFLLAIPLIIAKKWKTVFVAAAISLAATYIASQLIGKSMVELILEVPKIKHTAALSVNFLPDAFSQSLVAKGVSVDLMQGLNMLIGILLCIFMSWCLRKSEDWLIRFAPPVFCATLWTYMNDYDRCIFFVLQIVFACRLLSAKSKSERFAMALMILVTFCSCLELVGMFTGVLGSIGEFIGVSNFVEHFLSFIYYLTLVSTTLLGIGLLVMCIKFAFGAKKENVI